MTVFMTYDDGNRLEDVEKLVYQMSPTDTPFTSGMARSRATNTYHEWPEDTLAARADNAVIEGAAFSYGAVTGPSRVFNVTQIFEKLYQVSSTERWVKGAGVNDMYAYQETKALLEINNDVEHAFLRGSRATGNASTARRLAGAINFITTNATTVASGTTLTESFFNGLQELCWDQGGEVDEVYVAARLKRVISSYTANQTKNVAGEDRRLVNAVDVYESDFSVVKIFKSRDIPSTTNSNATCLLVDSAKNRMAIGEATKILSREEVAQTVHGTNGVIRCEKTLEVKAERHQAVGIGFDTSFV